jgi:PAS domain S-box-containing protein
VETKNSSRFHAALQACGVLLLCYFAAKLGGMLVITEPQVLWPVWPGCAVLVAVLYISPRKNWPLLIPAGLAGFALYDLPAGVPLKGMAILLLSDLVEIATVIWGIQYFLNGVARLDSLKSFARYAFVTVILGPLLGLAIGIHAMSGDWWTSARNSFLSDGLAFLTLAPAILGWADRIRSHLRPGRIFYVEAVALMSALLLLSFGMFVGGTAHTSPALLYSLVPFLVWSALRFGAAGAGTAASIVTLVSIWGAVHGRGPFVEADPIHKVLDLQLFILFTAVPFMSLAVLVEERKQQEADLRESQERFRLMADHSPTLIWMSRTDKLCTFFNRAWLNFTGRSMEQELGNGWVEGVHKDDLERCLGIYNAAFDSRTDFAMEYRLRRYDGEYRWIVDYGVPRFGTNGTFCGYIGSCLDITERKLAELSMHRLTGRLINAQEEERARIARELHDDISQRMAFLQIGLEQFEQRMLRLLSAGDRQSLHNLTQVMSEVSSDLHSISRQLHPAKLDLQGLVPAMNSFCKEFSEKHGPRVNFLHGDFPEQVPKDVALCLFRVVQEALRNIAKHTTSSEATVELSAQGEWINLSISDHGAGFNPESVQGKGGLGLVSMRERLGFIGGNLRVESQPPVGTRIRVRVPLKDADATRTGEPQPVKSSA